MLKNRNTSLWKEAALLLWALLALLTLLIPLLVNAQQNTPATQQKTQLLTSQPANGATEVAVDTPIELRFVQPMDIPTFNSETITLVGVTGPVNTAITASEKGQVISVQPEKQLLPGNSYNLMLKGVQDAQGQPLDFTVIAFQTAKVSNTPPAKSAQQRLKGNKKTSAGKSDWQPNKRNYQGDWTSGRVFKHSRDFISEQKRRYEFIDSLSPQARSVVEKRWKSEGVLTEARTRVLFPRARKVRAATSASVAGQVLRLDGQPLAGVTLSMAGKSVQSDQEGNFTLAGISPGGQTLAIDGRSASSKDSTYGRFDYHMVVQQGQNELDFTFWMPKLDTDNVVQIPSPTKEETVITHPDLPGLELHIPAGTVIRDAEGKIVTEVGITPLPLDQSPFPMPYNDVPVFFTIQPGGATLHSDSAKPSPGAWLAYPNYSQQNAGARVQLFDYDPKGRGWYTYTMGTVNQTEDAIIPDQAFTIYQFNTISSASPGDKPPPEEPKC
ncbi:MAG: Ig-like domain-containing protein, partial [Enterobacteriaceae bacterium]